MCVREPRADAGWVVSRAAAQHVGTCQPLGSVLSPWVPPHVLVAWDPAGSAASVLIFGV